MLFVVVPWSLLCLVLVLRFLSSEGHLRQLRSSFLFVQGETLGGIYVVREILCRDFRSGSKLMLHLTNEA
jgi:hypothetical protein